MKWENLYNERLKKASTLAFGIFQLDGTAIQLNEAMCRFMGTTINEKTPKHQLVNPTFEILQEIEQESEEIFNGVITISNMADLSFALNAKVYRDNNEICILAEPDVMQLFLKNKQMSSLNQQVNNLQRNLIREKKKLEQTLKELRETQQMLIQSEKMNALGQMVAGIAHEINNPIAFVTNNLHELKKNSNDLFDSLSLIEHSIQKSQNSELIEMLNSVYEQFDVDFLKDDIPDIITESINGVERVKKIVSDLRRFSRLDESDIKHIDLIENVASVLSIVKSEIDKKQIDFQFVTPDNIMMDCFPGQLNQAILNIVLNAIDAVKPETGVVRLEIRKNKETAEIKVTDNGYGIETENLEKIFNPFFTTKPVGSGTGLGLSITYKIINDLHEGSIIVKSAINKGTEIKVDLPLKLKG